MTESAIRQAIRRHDRIAGGVILCLLAAVGIAVCAVGRNVEPVPIPVEGELASADGYAPPADLSGYALGETLSFNAETLYEYINGQAPRYIDFGFQGLTVGQYDPASDEASAPPLVVDVYDMGARRNAYGIFADNVSPEDDALEAGNAGIVSGNMAAFWKGPYFVRVSSPTDDDAQELVMRAAREVAGMIEDDEGGLRWFKAFPSENLVPDSRVFVKSSALGLAHFESTFLADYENDDGVWTLLLCDMESPEQVRELLEAHEAALRSDGEVIEAADEGEQNAVWGKHKYIGPMLLVGRGDIAAGCVGLSDRAHARVQVDDLLENLRSVRSEAGGE